MFFHSKPLSTKKLYLSFNGRPLGSWGIIQNVYTPPFEGDSAARTTICQFAAHAFDLWDIDVTDEDPGNETNGQTAIISIGGQWSDWHGIAEGGTSNVGGFYNGASNVGFVFSQSLSGDPRILADAAIHEAGHLFGLSHQALWVDNVLVAEYRTDGAFMGVPYGNQNPFWTVGKTPYGADQDDVAWLTHILGTSPPDDHMTASEKSAILSAATSLRSLADSLAALAGTTSSDGTRITAPNGTITASGGTVFSFGGPTTGGYAILVNGYPNGGATSLGIKGGVVYAFNNSNTWFKWTGTTWQKLTFDPFA